MKMIMIKKIQHHHCDFYFARFYFNRQRRSSKSVIAESDCTVVTQVFNLFITASRLGIGGENVSYVRLDHCTVSNFN